jgi:hypothetical protein
MAKEWSVVSNSGEHVILKRGAERKKIPIPAEPTARKMFLKLVPPGTVTDDGLQLLLHSKAV